jgi:hypothetical protein
LTPDPDLYRPDLLDRPRGFPDLPCPRCGQTGSIRIVLDDSSPLARMAGLPWGSVVTLHSAGERFHRLVKR